jgi:D-lactate dehydrogenase
MKICFLETEESEQLFFETQLGGLELIFADHLQRVESDVEVLSIYIHFPIDSRVLDRFPRLEMIASRSMGYDHIDLEECGQRNITVSYVPGTDANSVAEHTFALMLALSRRLNEVRVANHDRKFSYEKLRGFEIKGKTLGIVGTGRVGLRVAHIALAFGMNVIAYEPYRQSLMAEIVGLTYVSLDQLLASSHVISIHTPLTPETLHMLDRGAFAKMRRGVVLINTARGAVIETSALIEALDAGIVAGTGLDVLEEESVMQKEATRIMTERIVEHLQTESPEEFNIKHPERLKQIQTIIANRNLLARPNVVFTPHVAFNSVEAVERINVLTVENIKAYLLGEPINRVTRALQDEC